MATVVTSRVSGPMEPMRSVGPTNVAPSLDTQSAQVVMPAPAYTSATESAAAGADAMPAVRIALLK
jgi:hypothetical protein